MYYHALATDYDGTLAEGGRVGRQTIESLRKLRSSGRKLILVSGRIIKDLFAVFPESELFDCMVGENGAVLYWPSTRETKMLAHPMPAKLVEELRRRGISPLSIGKVLVATWEPHEGAALEAIRELGLELQLIFNKGAVMILPTGINKGTGLSAALHSLGLSRHNVVGVGDAENDHAFLDLCECSAAVANALPSVRERSDLRLGASHGAGVVDLIERMLADDLANCHTLDRRRISLGMEQDGKAVAIPAARGSRILFCGPSGTGKSTLATALLERLAEQENQFCLIDPEGDYEQFAGAVTFGGAHQVPEPGGALKALANPVQNVIVNLVGMPLDERPAFLARLYPLVQKMRADVGRPHWLFLDEAHHMMPASGASILSVEAPADSVLVTVSPAALHPAVLQQIDVVVATARASVEEFSRAVGEPAPRCPTDALRDDALVWLRRENRIAAVKPERSHITRRRHRRKYAEGELPPDRSFYFRGAQRKMNLRADNLKNFLQLAQGVDEDTWRFHLVRGDYSRWIRESLKDAALADEVGQIERTAEPENAKSRALIRAAIERRYTAAA
jgi:hydroxymethylpyrimidine pyrophosphatase-like HAD family hydrolase